MHRLILACLLLMGCATIADTPAPEPTFFDSACSSLEAVIEYDNPCLGVEPPQLIVSYIVTGHFYNTMGTLRGIHYRDEPYVFVSPELAEAEQFEVAVHEAVHYILFAIEPDIGKCNSEELARRATDVFMGRDYDDSWEELYQCGKYQDSSTSSATQ